MYALYDPELAKSIAAMGMALVRQMKEAVDLLEHGLTNLDNDDARLTQ